jgi:dipeptidyl aminopeptidase/acylaminoacyl peptidase
MLMGVRCAAMAALVLSAVSLSAADDSRFPSNEDLRHVRAMAQPRLSPDGRSVLLQVIDSTADGAKSHLWLVDIKLNTARQLTWTATNDKRGEYSGQWMPDGDSILFLAHRGEHTQLYQLPMEGGEARIYNLKAMPTVDESTAPDAILAKKADEPAAKQEPIELDIEQFDIAPDGRTIALIARDPETAGERKQRDEKADAISLNHNPHGTKLYLLDTESGKLTPASVPPDVSHAAWSKQGDRLVAIAEAMNDAGDLEPARSAWMVSIGDPSHPSQMKQIPATVDGGAWSEDGRRFYFLAQATQDAPPGYSDLFALTFADGSVKDLTAGLEGSMANEDPISESGKVLDAVEVGTRVAVERFEGDRRETLKFDSSVVTQLNTNAKQTGWVWLGASSTGPNTLYYAEKLGHSAKTLNAPSLLPASWTRIPSQVVQWKNEGLTIEGLLYLPPQASSRKVPLIVDVHDGPTRAWEDAYRPLTGFLLAQGWAILRPNPRGSTGYGASFAAANKNDLGGADYRDIMTGVDAVLARYPIDPNKLGLMGYSYGGEMAAFVEGKTDRFKAIVSGAPVIDQNSEYGTEIGSWYDRWFYGKPWEHQGDVWRQSPLSTVAHAKTPFLLLQGEADKSDPPGQSLEMYRALRQMNVPVEMVLYPREDHSPLASGIFGMPSPEPWHGFDARQRIVKFFRTAFGEGS